ncbi:MAG: ABC transporter substrate-binding protein [Oscillospiraceae bacterium]
MKKILALIVAAVMLLSLCACGASVDTAKLDEIQAALDNIQASLDQLADGAAAPAPAPEAEPADAPAAPAGDTETLSIGLMVHTTGWFAGVDTPNFNEFNAMVDYINQNGGWTVGDTTYMLEAVCVDGQSDYPALRTAAMSLVDAGVDFVVETNDFWVNSCADVFEDEGILHASAYCVGSNTGYLIPENSLAFTGTNGSMGDLQACFAVLKEYYPDVHTVAYANDDNGSTDETYAILEEMAADNGFEMVGSVVYPGDTTDYSSYAQQLVDTGADAFMGNGSPDAYGALLKAVRSLDDDMVMACAQGKPVSMVMEYAGADASYNGFTIGASTRASDADRNTDMFNDLVEVVREKYGDDAAGTFDGAAANTLYIMLQMMQKAGSIDPAEVAAAWEAGGEVDSLYGTATIGGTDTYGMENHAVGHPRPVSMMDPEAEDGWEFAGWIDVIVP